MVATTTNSYGLHNEEFGAAISVCNDPIKPDGRAIAKALDPEVALGELLRGRGTQ